MVPIRRWWMCWVGWCEFQRWLKSGTEQVPSVQSPKGPGLKTAKPRPRWDSINSHLLSEGFDISDLLLPITVRWDFGSANSSSHQPEVESSREGEFTFKVKCVCSKANKWGCFSGFSAGQNDQRWFDPPVPLRQASALPVASCITSGMWLSLS